MKSLSDANSNFLEELNRMLNQPNSEAIVNDDSSELFYFEDRALDPITNNAVNRNDGENNVK